MSREKRTKGWGLMSQGAMILAVAALMACNVPVEGVELTETGEDVTEVEQGVLGRVKNPNSFILFTQNMKQLKMARWRHMVKCLGDPACNGAGGVPDVILLTEVSEGMADRIIDQLKAPVSSGGLGISGWGKYAVNNWRSTSGHWMSNAIIFNSNRFDVADRKAVEFETGQGTQGSCGKNGTFLPFLKLKDRVREDAGHSNIHVALVVRHDDHFGNGIKVTCPNPVSRTEFCTWNNSQIIDNNMFSATIQVMAGDWNYQGKYCEYRGEAYPGWKYAYECTTKGLACSSSRGNLGYIDFRLRHNPAVYNHSSPIDYLHYKGAAGATAPTTRRNNKPGVVGQHFYCNGHGPYTGPENDTTAWTDHPGLISKFTY